MQFDVTVVVNLHAEGALASATLASVDDAIDRARQRGIVCECLAVLDRANAETRATLATFGPSYTIAETDFGDPAQARNHAVSLSAGRYCAFVDGDDLWGKDWIWRAFHLLEGIGRDDVIAHPRFNLYFGRGISPYVWIHPDMRFETVTMDDLVANNKWTALSFARTQLYKRFPYHGSQLTDGFGYEDWLWNIETMHNGVLHVCPDHTIHCIRRKTTTSHSQLSTQLGVLPNLAKIFRTSPEPAGVRYFPVGDSKRARQDTGRAAVREATR